MGKGLRDHDELNKQGEESRTFPQCFRDDKKVQYPRQEEGKVGPDAMKIDS